MKNSEARHIIRYYFKRLNKNAEQMKKGFNEEAVHLFRVDVKKLRAFLRMLRPAAEEPYQLKFPRKFKKMYSLTGNIRDRQLYIKRIKEDNKTKGSGFWNKVHGLEKEIKALSGKRDDFLTKKEFEEIEACIIKQLPLVAGVALVKSFFHQKLTNITGVVVRGDYKYTELHSIRKSIKDIIYVTGIFRDVLKSPMPFNFWNEAQLKKVESLSHRLGLFNDACIALSFLQPADINKTEAVEKEHLQSVRRKWLGEKQKLKKQILNEIQTIKWRL